MKIKSTLFLFIFTPVLGYSQGKQADYLNAIEPVKVVDIREAFMALNRHGLKTSDYWTADMEAAYSQSSSSMDKLVKENYLKLLQDLNGGSVNPESLGKNFLLKKRVFVSPSELNVLRLNFNDNALALMESFAPKTPHYKSLQEALRRMDTMCRDGSWRALRTITKALKINSRDVIIPEIKERLRQHGYLIATSDDLFDESTLRAVNNIQTVLQFKPDGIISPGGKTWSYLNASCEGRLELIRADLEKFRWFPREFGDRYLFVNLAHNYLTLIDRPARIAQVMKVIVGRSARQTPTLSDKITYITINPFWVVPPTIFKEDKLSDLKNLNAWEVADYFSRNNYEVWDRSLKRRYEPWSFDWTQVGPKTPIYIRQKPGLHNALGVLKFNLTNDEAIYLHDTNQRELFGDFARQLSSGCVRVEKPFDLAEYLLKGTKWDRQELEFQVAQPGEVPNKDQNVSVINPLPVYMFFQAVTFNSDGVMRFADDTYAQTKLIMEAQKR